MTDASMQIVKVTLNMGKDSTLCSDLAEKSEEWCQPQAVLGAVVSRR
jgi:hypothetical protein